MIAETSQALVSLVAMLVPQAVASGASFENAFGIRFQTEADRGGFHELEARDVTLAGVQVDLVSYRGPRDGTDSSRPAILILSLDDRECVSLAKLRSLRPEVEPDGGPSPEEPDGDMFFSHYASDTVLSFGFPYEGADCLRTIIYSVNRP